MRIISTILAFSVLSIAPADSGQMLDKGKCWFQCGRPGVAKKCGVKDANNEYTFYKKCQEKCSKIPAACEKAHDKAVDADEDARRQELKKSYDPNKVSPKAQAKAQELAQALEEAKKKPTEKTPEPIASTPPVVKAQEKAAVQQEEEPKATPKPIAPKAPPLPAAKPQKPMSAEEENEKREQEEQEEKEAQKRKAEEERAKRREEMKARAEVKARAANNQMSQVKKAAADNTQAKIDAYRSALKQPNNRNKLNQQNSEGFGMEDTGVERLQYQTVNPNDQGLPSGQYYFVLMSNSHSELCQYFGGNCPSILIPKEIMPEDVNKDVSMEFSPFAASNNVILDLEKPYNLDRIPGFETFETKAKGDPRSTTFVIVARKIVAETKKTPKPIEPEASSASTSRNAPTTQEEIEAYRSALKQSNNFNMLKQQNDKGFSTEYLYVPQGEPFTVKENDQGLRPGKYFFAQMSTKYSNLCQYFGGNCPSILIPVTIMPAELVNSDTLAMDLDSFISGSIVKLDLNKPINLKKIPGGELAEITDNRSMNFVLVANEISTK